MRSLILAAALVTFGAATASAQYGGPWGGGERYGRSYSGGYSYSCAEKQRRMGIYHRRAVARDGYVDKGEQQVLRQMQRDYEASCLYGNRRWR